MKLTLDDQYNKHKKLYDFAGDGLLFAEYLDELEDKDFLNKDNFGYASNFKKD